jgi:hypothetical protein
MTSLAMTSPADFRASPLAGADRRAETMLTPYLVTMQECT